MTLARLTRIRNRLGWASLVGLAALFCLSGCGTTQTVGSTTASDCTPSDAAMVIESVIPLPEDHDLSNAEVWKLLEEHTLHEKHVVDQSNDKTHFIQDNCQPNIKAARGAVPTVDGKPAAPLPEKKNDKPSWLPSWL